MAEAERLADDALWPGFDLPSIPVAIYDGVLTWLFRHPAPPAGFEPVEGRPDVRVRPGRHPAVTANTSVLLGGIPTATLIPATASATLRERAGVLIHEAFHVHQHRRYPAWAVDETALFLYPSDDRELLAWRRLESVSLYRSLTARSPEAGACWARIALDYRRRRFDRMDGLLVAYERGIERYEGLAQYVEAAATDVPDAGVLPARGVPAAAVRQRAYASGAGLARLLDRYRPGWKTEAALERSGLDEMLTEAIPRQESPSCGIEDAADIAQQARADAAALEAERERRRAAFLGRDGWTLVVTVTGSPLFPRGFDPLNLDRVGDTEVLHTRFLRLGNEVAAVEVLDRPALTVAAGAHPLFDGVRRVTVTGLRERPIVETSGTRTTIRADGLEARFENASLTRNDRQLRVEVAPTR